MGPSPSRSIALAIVMMVLSACSSRNKSAATVAPQPVDSARPNPANGTPATFGVPAAIGALKVTTSHPVVESDASGPWLTVSVRAENATLATVHSPRIELRCAGSAAGGTWLPTSTFKQDEPVPAKSFGEGTVSLVIPGDERLGGPRPSCATPATVVATLLTFDNTGAGAPVQKRVAWTVPAELIQLLNAAAP